ncbi:hypothetical protein MAR_006370 [Mya arenaria]|uniref:Uncharacterized protein n=1 Tax=Mya arenaria TaxID=6604 RepID=A0ABY7D8A0_MYAAR|nr:hypothetical protein MAR_006370 [Mya arenaria]
MVWSHKRCRHILTSSSGGK